MDEPLVIDSHAHIFPWLGGASGFESAAMHKLYLQKVIVGHVQPIKRLGSRATVGDEGIPWDPNKAGISGHHEVGLKVSSFGRFSWKNDGIEYYLQYMPPWLEKQEASAELILAMMDHAGVDVAVLQNDHVYGDLNAYFADAIRRFPNRFIGTIQVDEIRADEDDQIGRLHDGVQMGLRGLFYKPSTFFRVDFREAFDAPRFTDFWSSVQKLRLPTYWDLVPIPNNTKDDYLDQLRRFASWAERYPDIPCLLVQAMPTRLLFSDGHLEVPPLLSHLCRERGLMLELCLPIVWGRWCEYPFHETAPIIASLYDEVGPNHLVWGSDIPNIERYCTYRQSVGYIRRICPFFSESELAEILGGNLQRFFSGPHLGAGDNVP